MGEHDRFQVVHMNFAVNEKIVFFTKVFASCNSTSLFVNKSYLKDEEVLLDYEIINAIWWIIN